MTNLFGQAKTLESEGHTVDAIKFYDEIIQNENKPESLAYVHFRLGVIYQEWNELFAAQRFLSHAHQLKPEDTEIRVAVETLNQSFSENRDQIADRMSRQNSDHIVSLFRIATGIKLISMDKPVQAYPLMKSRTKIYPNAAVAKHLLTDISITEEELNSAIEFLIERDWLISTGPELYTITNSGLYAFYTTLAQLHVDNTAYTDAISCYEQAYWINNIQSTPLYNQVICYAFLNQWNKSVSLIPEQSNDIPNEVDQEAYYTAVAQSYHHIFQQSSADSDRQKAIKACEAVLQINQKNKGISKLLESYQVRKHWWQK